MKKITAIALAAMMLLSLAACGKDETKPAASDADVVVSAADVSGSDAAASGSDAEEEVYNVVWTHGDLSLSYPSNFDVGANQSALDSTGALLAVAADKDSPSSPSISVMKMSKSTLLINTIRDFDSSYGEIAAGDTLEGLAEFVGMETDDLQLSYNGVTYQQFGELEGAVVDYNIHFEFGGNGNSITFYYKSILIVDGDIVYTVNYATTEAPVDAIFADSLASITCK